MIQCLRCLFLFASLAILYIHASAESLKDYAAKCLAATGIDLGGMDCDKNGDEIPTLHPSVTPAIYDDAKLNCDEPNRLDRKCDPGSRMQVRRSNGGYAVLLCRRKGATKTFRDVAIIQHNTVNGATCFYQALPVFGGLEEFSGAPPNPVSGEGSPKYWGTPAQTADVRCVRCHDTGAIVRSPYVAQMSKALSVPQPNVTQFLPGTDDTSDEFGDFNRVTPYSFVGSDFANWRAFKVDVPGNFCISCHRMGVSNLANGENGTSLDFGIRATAKSEVHKNPYTDDDNPFTRESHIWMPPNRGMYPFHHEPGLYDQENANAAMAIRNCALKLGTAQANTPTCKISLFAQAFQPPTVAGVSTSGPLPAALIQYEIAP